MLSGPVGRIVNRLTKLSNIFISQNGESLDNGFRKSKISSPDRYYEQGELPLNEGPQILKHGKDVFVVYSCGQSWLDTYKLSYLRLKDPDADLLDPKSWIKSDKPVFEGTDQVFGVGHASFTTSPDDREHYIYYHTKKRENLVGNGIFVFRSLLLMHLAFHVLGSRFR